MQNGLFTLVFIDHLRQQVAIVRRRLQDINRNDRFVAPAVAIRQPFALYSGCNFRRILTKIRILSKPMTIERVRRTLRYKRKSISRMNVGKLRYKVNSKRRTLLPYRWSEDLTNGCMQTNLNFRFAINRKTTSCIIMFAGWNCQARQSFVFAHWRISSGPVASSKFNFLLAELMCMKLSKPRPRLFKF